MVKHVCKCSRCGRSSNRPPYKKGNGEWGRTPCPYCNRGPYCNRVHPIHHQRSGKPAGKMTKRDQILKRVNGGAFNPDGSIRLIPLGKSKEPHDKEKFLRKAAKILSDMKKKKPSTFQGSCRPIDKKDPKPPDTDDGSGGCGGPTISGKLPIFTSVPCHTPVNNK